MKIGEAMEEAGKDSDYNTYGDEVTLIPDTASYDWGDLSDINARITALEQKYGFSIYFGPRCQRELITTISINLRTRISCRSLWIRLRKYLAVSTMTFHTAVLWRYKRHANLSVR